MAPMDPVLVEEENVGSLLGEENETYVQPPSSTGENVSAIVEEVNEGKAVLEKVRTVLEMESASIELALPEPSAECEIGVADVAVDNNAITLIDVQNVEGGEEVVLITREASAAPVIESASPEVNLPEPSAECESLVADVTIDDKTIPGEDVPNVEDAEERLSNKEEVSALPEIRSTIACQALPEPSAESKCEVADETAEENDIPVEAVNPEPEPSPGIKVELGSLDVTATQEAPTAANENSPSIQPTPSAESEPEALKDNEEDNVDEQDSRKVEETATKSDSALVASEGDEILAGSEGLNQHDLTVAQRLAVTISDPADDLTPSKCDDVPVPGNGDQLKLVDKIKAEDDNSINVEDNNLVNVADGKDETHVQLLVSSDEVIVAKVAGVEEGLTATEKFSAVPEIERASTELVLPEPSAECESEFADGIVDDKAATPVEAVNQESQPSPDCAAEELPPSIQPTPSVENEREALKSNEEANVDEQDGSQVAETATKAVSALVASECEEILANSEDLSRLDSNDMPNLAEPMSAVVEDVTQQNSGDTNEVELVTTETVDVDDKQVEIVVESTPSGPDVDEIEESTTEKVAQSSDHERAADDQHDFRPVDNLEVEVDNPTDIEGENTLG
ncbi:expressed protein [Phakopsora pachyrhizi]|uniref:Expressed protein n=1 Tax=Phakopsora pachyrhizi TaxID=170000 RepID=A0AAV0AGT6_PHAPC|nr:expressed protein [Phakopsora pachyrhizi]